MTKFWEWLKSAYDSVTGKFWSKWFGEEFEKLTGSKLEPIPEDIVVEPVHEPTPIAPRARKHVKKPPVKK